MAFDPEQHRANQDANLQVLREQFKLLPELPRIEQMHTLSIIVGDDTDDSDFIICCHDAANACKHHVIYPAKCVQQGADIDTERGRLTGHIERILAAAYN